VILKIRPLKKVFLLLALVVLSCGTTPAKTPNSTEQPRNGDARAPATGIAEEIRSLVETGVLSSLTQAQELLRSRDLGSAEFGRVMNGLITIIVRRVYPDSLLALANLDLPQTSVYNRIIREADRGEYVHPGENSTDFFEYVLPFFAINDETSRELLVAALKNLAKAGELRPNSVLPPYFSGLINERMNQFPDAAAAYRKAYSISSEFYPAMTGQARVLALTGKRTEAAAMLSDLMIRYPDSQLIKRQLAITYYEARNWSRALPIVDDILQGDPRNGEFLLIKAHILIEQGNFTQANSPLDTYASINSNNRQYLFLRARLQAEGNRNRDSALNYLRSILRTNPDDEEAVIYAAGLLMDSQRPSDQEEGRALLDHLRQMSGSSIFVQSLSLRDAIRRENWKEAQGYLNRILPVRRTDQDLHDAYTVERGLNNNARALTFARELYERNTSNNEYTSVYISALIDNGRREEASRLLETRIAAAGAGADKSRYFFLRSRVQTNEEAALGDLRSSLFEDPRNLDALIAMFEIYHRRREERRAVHYLRQALALSPDNPRLKRYEAEYASLLGRN
jgi:tetratricopeptide (TPR) repeat protein